MQEIRQVLTGSFKKKLIPVFDGIKATSTVRFIVDSVLKGEALSPEAMAAQSSEGVIDYVSRNPGTIGFIGVSWIGNKEDEEQKSFLKKVRIAYLESTDSIGTFVQPVQNNIYLGIYPMVRDLFYIRKERHNGLAYGLSMFMKGHIGQLIFKRAYLVPTQKKYTLRPIRLNE
jgi:phosphate transport system substrate-binding protein